MSDAELEVEFGEYVEEAILRLLRVVDREADLFMIMAESSRVEKLSDGDRLTLQLALRSSLSLTLYGKNVNEIVMCNSDPIGKLEALRYLASTLNSVEKITHEVIGYTKERKCRSH